MSKFGTKAALIFNKYGYRGDDDNKMSELIDALEQLAADEYGHVTVNGWCCACPADIAFAKHYLLTDMQPSSSDSTQSDANAQSDTNLVSEGE